jgi:hypothetical protein
MKCPICESQDGHVIDSRYFEKDNVIRRRRGCDCAADGLPSRNNQTTGGSADGKRNR